MSRATGWRLTSVRWLEQHYSHYVRLSGGAPERLLRALAAMGYGNADQELRDKSGLMGTAAELRQRMVDRWDETEHRMMVAYLENGGYKGRKDELLGIISIETTDGSELESITVVESEAGKASAEPEADEGVVAAVVAEDARAHRTERNVLDDGIGLDEVVASMRESAGSW